MFLCSRSSGNAQSLKENKMVVSITGATGFIGRRLVQKLLSDNHGVHVLTRSRRNAQLIFPGKKLKASLKLQLLRNGNGGTPFKFQMLLLTWPECR